MQHEIAQYFLRHFEWDAKKERGIYNVPFYTSLHLRKITHVGDRRNVREMPRYGRAATLNDTQLL